MGRTKRLGLLGVLVCALALALAACGSSKSSGSSSGSSSSSGGGSSSTSSSTKASNFKLGVVTDVGGLNDHGFNHLAYAGMLAAEKQLGIQARVLPSSSSADYVPNLTSLAREGYNLVIATGFNFETPLSQVAKQFPNTKFAIIDDTASDVKGNLPNVEGLTFKEEQAGYLVGYLAGLVSKAKGYKEISSVSGQNYPSVTNYVAGYQQGAAKADPGIKTVNAFSYDFADQSKCQTIAQNQIQQGAKIVFQVAGGCGLGALQAAKQAGDLGIGVDADQSFLGSYILTSAEKKVDTAVLDATKAAMNGSFKGGSNLTFDLNNGGVGFGTLNAAGKPYASKIAAVASQIKSGKISISLKYHNS